MTLEQQVSNLELSQRLKELGVPQEGLFYWQHFGSNDEDEFVVDYCKNLMGRDEKFSALTVAELREELKKAKPSSIYHAYWNCGGSEDDGICGIILAVLDANFLAKMLIYLIENKLITI